MKRRTMIAVFLAASLLLFGIAAAESSLFSPYAESFSAQSVSAALSAVPPEDMDLSAREEDIYRLGFAAGYDQANLPDRGPGCAYVLNVNKTKFHLPDCQSVKDIKEANRIDYYGSRETLIEVGYKPCKNCNP